MLPLILILVFFCIAFIVYSFLPEKEIEVKDIKELYKKHKERSGIILLISPILSKLSVFNSKFKSKDIENYRKKLKKKLLAAGAPHGLTPDETLALKEISAVAVFFSAMLVTFILEMTLEGMFSLSFVFMFLGFFYPEFSLNSQIIKRHKSIRRALPYSLDLLTMAVEAGLDFGAAIGKVVEKGKPGPLNEEFFLMLQEIRLGKTRESALRDMSERVGLSDLSSILLAIIQASELGTSLGPILRIQSDQLRVRRYQSAEKLALEAPIKMLLPLLGFIFPAVFVVLFTPIIFQFIKSG